MRCGQRSYRTRRRVTASASIIALMIVAGCARGPRVEKITSSVDALLTELHASERFSGGEILGRDGEIIYADAWGPADMAAGVMWTPDTPVDGASLAKNFTAAAVWIKEGPASAVRWRSG